MLEHVALNQTRFHTPGIAPDARGVVLGKQGALLFPALDKLVAFFAVLSDEMPLDDLVPTLRIVEVRSPLKSRELLVLFHAASSYLVDRAARVTRTLGGIAFTGTAKHFVKYRDEASPLGYDVDNLASDSADFLLYSDAVTHACTRVKDIAFQQLVFRLSLRRLPGGKDPTSERDALWLAVAQGLGRPVVEYLWRNRVAAQAALVSPPEARDAAAATFRTARAYLLVRVPSLPQRMLQLFEQVPGIEIFRQVTENVVVELGWRHPLRLESCPSLFDKDKFYLYAGARDVVDVTQGPPPLVAGERLLTVAVDLGAPREMAGTAAPPERPLEVDLKLVPSNRPPRRATATLVPWEQATWLKQLVFALPPTLLAGYRVAAVDDGLLVVGPQGVDGLPLGDMLEEAAPSVYVPVGFEFLPRISEAVLTDHVGGTSGRVVVFRRGQKPFAVGDETFERLERRALGRIDIETRRRATRLPALPPPRDPEVRNDPVGPLPLWGYRGTFGDEST